MKLDEVLDTMDKYDWGAVPDYKRDLSKELVDVLQKMWTTYMDKANVKLNGLVLDSGCGPVSLATMYENVVGLDLDPTFIKELRKNGYRGVVGNFKCTDFDDDTFDLVYSSGVPAREFDFEKQVAVNVNIITHVNDIVSEMLRVSKSKVFFGPCIPMLPQLASTYFADYVKVHGEDYILLDKNLKDGYFLG